MHTRFAWLEKQNTSIMRISTILLGVLLILTFEEHRVQGRPHHKVELVYPERVHKTKPKKDLNTEVKEFVHEDVVSLELKTKQAGNLVLDLKKREDAPKRLLVRTYAEDGKPADKWHDPANCFYTGTVVGQELSDVSLSTCDQQINGVIDLGEKRYKIEPNNDEGQHKFLELKKRVNIPSWQEYIYQRPERVSSVYTPYMSEDQKQNTRYIEMHISVQGDLYNTLMNGQETNNMVILHLLNHVGQIDRIYSKVNVRVVLTAVEFQIYQGQDYFAQSQNADTELENFAEYAQWLKRQDGWKDASIDVSAFYRLNGYDDGEQGRGRMYSICRDDASFVVRFSDNYNMAAHELGHTLGMYHDSDKTRYPNGCPCPERYCLMAKVPLGDSFSTCSMQALQDITSGEYKDYGTCMNNLPQYPVAPRCGNGIKEGEEVCDCGTADMCAQKNSCCVPNGCTLKEDRSSCDAASGQ